MATHIITISATTDNPTPLTISDDQGHSSSTHSGDASLTTEFTAKGDDVLFVIDPNSDITSIDRIDVSPLHILGVSITLFSALPRPSNDGTTNWYGQLLKQSDNWHGEVTEKYSITYTVNGQSYTEDPRIRIKQ